MTTLFSFCDIHWIFPWLLPFLLGLALGYLLWARYKSMVADLQADLNSKNEIINGLNADLKAAISARSECEGSLSLLKGRISEMEATASSPSAALGLVTQAGLSTMGARTGGDDRYFLAKKY